MTASYERDFILGEIPGVLWTSGSAPAPLILSGHNGGLHKRNPRLVARARHYAAEYGFAVAAIDAPGHGDRPRSAIDEQARADLRRAMESTAAVDLFDAFGTRDKTLHANLGGHAGVPWFEVDDGARFFARHLR